MSRTIRRGTPSRNFHKYIGLDVLWCEHKRIHICHSYPGGWYNNISDKPLWQEREYQTYDDYAEFEIRKYHMDYRPWHKTPGWCHRVEVQKQKRLHKAALHHAVRNCREDELILVRLQQDAEWMWS